MTTQTQKFWKETPLANVAALVAKYRGYAKDEYSIENDMADMYNEDASDFHKAIVLFRQSDCESLAEHIAHMDTDPRENLVEAFWFDCGNEFVEENLGYEMSQSWIDFQSEKGVAV
jgi:hypothetical protein